MKLFEWLLGRDLKRAEAEAASHLVPRDPSGRVAGGASDHLQVYPGGDFKIHADRIWPSVLTWHSSDTSVARLEVAEDTLSALVKVVGPGRTELRVSDGLVAVTRVLTVNNLPALEGRSLDLRIEPVLSV